MCAQIRARGDMVSSVLGLVWGILACLRDPQAFRGGRVGRYMILCVLSCRRWSAALRVVALRGGRLCVGPLLFRGKPDIVLDYRGLF